MKGRKRAIRIKEKGAGDQLPPRKMGFGFLLLGFGSFLRSGFSRGGSLSRRFRSGFGSGIPGFRREQQLQHGFHLGFEHFAGNFGDFSEALRSLISTLSIRLILYCRDSSDSLVFSSQIRLSSSS